LRGFKNECGFALKDILIEITYIDIYENEMTKATQLLDIYKRHFNNDKRYVNESKMNKMDTLTPLLNYLQNGIKLSKVEDRTSDIENPKNELIIALWEKVKSNISEKNKKLIEKIENNPDDETTKKGLEYELSESLENGDFRSLITEMLKSIQQLESTDKQNRREKIVTKNTGDGNITVVGSTAGNITSKVKK